MYDFLNPQGYPPISKPTPLFSLPLVRPRGEIRVQTSCYPLLSRTPSLASPPSPMETHELARAVTEVTLKGFNRIYWEQWERDFRYDNLLHQFLMFKDQVFDAMAYFVWNIYDKEDFENIAFTKEIFKECENLWQSDSFKHGDLSQAILSSAPLAVPKKLEKIREHDICNILKWSHEEKELKENEQKNFADFESRVRLHRHSSLYHMRDLEDYVGKAMEIMDMPCLLGPKIKHHLRMELNKDKSPRCIVEALYMKLWKRMKIMELRKLATYKWMLDDLAEDINQIFSVLLRARLEQFSKCKSLVTYPLSSSMFGLWDNEALRVVEQADLIRRSEGRRFISVDHLLLGMPNAEVTNMYRIHDLLFSMTCPKYAIVEDHEESSKDGEQTEYTIYHVYQKSNEIAVNLGQQEIGLVHLFLAILAPDYEASWAVFFNEYLLQACEIKRNRAEDEASMICATSVWDTFLHGGSISGDFLEVVEKIQDASFPDPLKLAISKILDGQDEHSPMKKRRRVGCFQ